MPELGDLLLALADPPLAPPEPVDELERRVRRRRRRRRLATADHDHARVAGSPSTPRAGLHPPGCPAPSRSRPETEAIGQAAGQGAAFYVVALPPDAGRMVAVVAIAPDGQVLRRTPAR